MIQDLIFSCQKMMLNSRHLLETDDRTIDPVKLKVWYKACKYFLNEPYHPLVDPVDDTICDAVKNLKKQLQDLKRLFLITGAEQMQTLKFC